MTLDRDGTVPTPEFAKLVAELDRAEAYEQKLRQSIIEVRNELAAGHTALALSMLNGLMNSMDDATDVVAPHREP